VEPRWSPHQILDQLDHDGEPFEGLVHDPCCGGGTIVSVCRERGLVATGSDIVDRGFGAVRDVFCLNEPIDNAMSNLPYGKAEAIIRHLLPLVRRRMLLILPISFLCTRERVPLFREFPPIVYPCADRPCMPPGRATALRDPWGALIPPRGKNGSADYAWFRWDRGYRGPWENRPMTVRPVDHRQSGLFQPDSPRPASPQASLW
jgi:hypothetical protein